MEKVLFGICVAEEDAGLWHSCNSNNNASRLVANSNSCLHISCIFNTQAILLNALDRVGEFKACIAIINSILRADGYPRYILFCLSQGFHNSNYRLK